MSPEVEALLKHFSYDHLPARLQSVSKQFHELAWMSAANLDGPELTAGLRKLLEAKDCMVRAAVEPVHGYSNSGEPLTEDKVDQLADEAERGYDIYLRIEL